MAPGGPRLPTASLDRMAWKDPHRSSDMAQNPPAIGRAQNSRRFSRGIVLQDVVAFRITERFVAAPLPSTSLQFAVSHRAGPVMAWLYLVNTMAFLFVFPLLYSIATAVSSWTT